MGHVIAYSFPVEIEYDVSYDDRHMLDDGISGDETDNSDLSSNYEEFAEPDIILKVVEVPRKEQSGNTSPDVETDNYTNDNSMNDNYELSDENSTVEDGQIGEASSAVIYGSTMHVDGPKQRATNSVQFVPKSRLYTLKELQEADLHLQQCLEWQDSKDQKLLELREALLHIKRKISEIKNELQEEDKVEDMGSKRYGLEAGIRNARLSQSFSKLTRLSVKVHILSMDCARVSPSLAINIIMACTLHMIQNSRS